MPAKKQTARAERRAEKAERHKKRVPEQADGEFRGRHLAGFKGSKLDVPCHCAKCNPQGA